MTDSGGNEIFTINQTYLSGNSTSIVEIISDDSTTRITPESMKIYDSGIVINQDPTFEVDRNGKLTCGSIVVTGGNVQLYPGGTLLTNDIYVNGDITNAQYVVANGFRVYENMKEYPAVGGTSTPYGAGAGFNAKSITDAKGLPKVCVWAYDSSIGKYVLTGE